MLPLPLLSSPPKVADASDASGRRRRHWRSSYIEPSIDDLEIDAQVYLPGCYISRAASPSR